MKRFLCILLVCLMLPTLLACGKQAAQNQADSAAWNMGSLLTYSYSTLRHNYCYRIGTDVVYLSASRSKITLDDIADVTETRVKDGQTYCYTAYTTQPVSEENLPSNACKSIETCDGTLRYKLGNDTYSLDVLTLLTFDQAIALMQNPLSPPDGVTLDSEEWSAYFKMADCNLTIFLYPNDDGAKYTQRKEKDCLTETTEDGETFALNSETIAYRDDRGTALVTQLVRNAEGTSYLNVAFCKQLLDLLG